MATINMGSIMNKVDKWEKSSSGKKEKSDVIQQYRASGVSKTAGGGFVFTEDMMIKITNELIAELQRSAHRLELGRLLKPSVADHFESLRSDEPQQQVDGDYIVSIVFTDDLHRDSLLRDDGTRTGDGIDNIVELFEKGVIAKGSVFGLWESTGEYTWSQSRRPALSFIQSTIDRFNMKYRGTGCMATLMWE